MTLSIGELLSPYADIRLSSFDNMKLIKALLAEQGEVCECVELTREGEKGTRQFYAVKWHHVWLDCGWSNDYSAAISLMTEPAMYQRQEAQTVNVPQMTLQQISFMCMEYSHFDHC